MCTYNRVKSRISLSHFWWFNPREDRVLQLRRQRKWKHVLLAHLILKLASIIDEDDLRIITSWLLKLFEVSLRLLWEINITTAHTIMLIENVSHVLSEVIVVGLALGLTFLKVFAWDHLLVIHFRSFNLHKVHLFQVLSKFWDLPTQFVLVLRRAEGWVEKGVRAGRPDRRWCCTSLRSGFVE